MSYDYSAKNNKYSKVNTQQYLYDADEPADKFSHAARMEPDDDLSLDNYNVKLRFRQLANQLRSHY